MLWVNRCTPSSCMRAKQQQQQQQKQESGCQKKQIPPCLISSVSPPTPPHLLIPSPPLSSSTHTPCTPQGSHSGVFFSFSWWKKEECVTGGEGTRRLHQCLSTLQNHSCQKSRAGVPNSSMKAVYKISHHSASTPAARLPVHVWAPNTKAAGEYGVNDISSVCQSFMRPKKFHASSFPLHPYKEPVDEVTEWGKG